MHGLRVQPLENELEQDAVDGRGRGRAAQGGIQSYTKASGPIRRATSWIRVYVRQVQTRQRYELRCTDDLDHRWIVEVGQILRNGRSAHADIFSGEAERHSRVVKKSGSLALNVGEVRGVAAG